MKERDRMRLLNSLTLREMSGLFSGAGIAAIAAGQSTIGLVLLLIGAVIYVAFFLAISFGNFPEDE